MGIFTAVMTVISIGINAFYLIKILTGDPVFIDGEVYGCTLLNTVSYVFFMVVTIGNMWRKMNSETELYEMAGVSPLKVGAARMLTVFLFVTFFAILLMIEENIINTVYLRRVPDFYDNIFGSQYELDRYSMFKTIGLPWTNIFGPFFAGLYASILFTTSFAYTTLTKRIQTKIVAAFILAVLIGGVLLLNITVLGKINLYMPWLNLNNLGSKGLFIYRFGPAFTGGDYEESALYFLNPNLLNMGLLIFQSLYATLMFTVYSMRRKTL